MDAKPPRRKRYSGTHPRRFEEKYKELQPQAYPSEHAKVRAQGRTPAGTHVPIMLREVREALHPRPGETVLDCTLGYGGHAEALARAGARVIGIDLDAAELARTAARLEAAGLRVSAHHTNFAGIGGVLAAEGVAGVDCLLADLGISSMQLDDPARGFAFKRDGALDMRMDQTRGRTAAELIRQIDEQTLAEMLRDCDEPYADKLAAMIKHEQPQTTHALAQLTLRAHGLDATKYRKRRAADQHPAARVFQALRIAVNRETENLDQLLRTLPYILNPGGRAALITFHSGEERRVREALQHGQTQGHYQPTDTTGQRPTREEIHNNPRARSARLFTAVRAA
jgi:16S rRNA (cytosine1402-N4)-methyltransferase